MKRKFSSNLLNRLHICGMSAGITNERVLSIYLQDNLIIPLVVNCLTIFLILSRQCWARPEQGVILPKQSFKQYILQFFIFLKVSINQFIIVYSLQHNIYTQYLCRGTLWTGSPHRTTQTYNLCQKSLVECVNVMANFS